MKTTSLIPGRFFAPRRFRGLLPALAVAVSLSFFLDLHDLSRLRAEESADAERDRDTEAAAAVEARLRAAAEYLASEELEGRGVGTAGLDLAADYIAQQFADFGLKTDLFGGSPFQKFTMATHTERGPAENNRLTLVGPPNDDGQPIRVELQLGDDFNPLAIGGSGEFDVPLVFAGYGITADEHKYDDFADVDVKGKGVVILRHTPQHGNPHGRFATPHGPSRHAYFTTKISNAYQQGAAMVILVNCHAEIESQIDQHRRRWDEAIDALHKAHAGFRQLDHPTREQLEEHRAEIERLANAVRRQGERLKEQYDPLLGFTRAGTDSGGRDMPVLFCRRAAIEPMIRQALGSELADVERAIDEGPKPHSRPLDGWRAEGETRVVRQQAEVKNVVAVLEGEGPLADETIVVGAHYDHLGRGGPGSLARGSNEIHPGADDNASGTAVLLEIARTLADSDTRLPRRVVFIAFTAEERGLLGSSHYVNNPLYPLENTIAMLNMDMVGRLSDNKLVIQGVQTAAGFDELLETLNARHRFELTKQPGGFGPSDHASFYARQIPVMHFFTGSHGDYHRPGDTADKLNVPGMRRIGELVLDVTLAIARAESRPEYREAQSPMARRGGTRPYFGSIPDFTQAGEGYSITGVTRDSPADKAGIRGGDVLLMLGDNKIANLEDFDTALRKFQAGDRVPVLLNRDGQEVKVEVVLDDPR